MKQHLLVLLVSCLVLLISCNPVSPVEPAVDNTTQPREVNTSPELEPPISELSEPKIGDETLEIDEVVIKFRETDSDFIFSFDYLSNGQPQTFSNLRCPISFALYGMDSEGKRRELGDQSNLIISRPVEERNLLYNSSDEIVISKELLNLEGIVKLGVNFIIEIKGSKVFNVNKSFFDLSY